MAGILRVARFEEMGRIFWALLEGDDRVLRRFGISFTFEEGVDAARGLLAMTDGRGHRARIPRRPIPSGGLVAGPPPEP